ncbi:MAG: serine hydrolase [Oscillochloridaceae bacterium]|nr:class A beta-lactamase-related serine hydrolase [Chloroflexaceae bacterium]MDW8391584.1 serine hydrolase [Oscillochloridaceae bacterium]
MTWPRFAAISLLCLALVANCAPVASQRDPSAPAGQPGTAVAVLKASAPTPTPVFATGTTVAGITVAGLTLDQAERRLRAALSVPPEIEVRVGSLRRSLGAELIGLTVPVEELLTRAAPALAGSTPVTVSAAFDYDQAALRREIAALAAEVAVPPTIHVITSTEALSRSFGFTPGRILEVDAAVARIGQGLAAGDAGPFTLTLSEDATPPRAPLIQLREEVEALAAEWPGVVGFQLIDLQTGASVGFHEHTVFAGASTIKTAIMLNTYVNLDDIGEREQELLAKMIGESDNLAANDLLAAAAGGRGTEYAFVGADAMSIMLQEKLGLKHTYLYIPFEATDYIRLYKPKFRCGPKGPVGEKPYTEHGNCLRAEPASMARLYQLIDQCAANEGLLLERFERLTAARCQEMLDYLAANDDQTRLVAGVPPGVRVEHKSGWIEDMQADAGIVRSPNGAYAIAIYIYRPLPPGRHFWPDELMAPVVAAFSRLAYTAYNPVRLDRRVEESGHTRLLRPPAGGAELN